MGKLLKMLFSRVVIVGALIVLQAAILFIAIWQLSNYFIYLYLFFVLLSLGVVVWLINKTDNPSYKLAWIILVMVFPIFGGLFYVMMGRRSISRSFRKRMERVAEDTLHLAQDNVALSKELEQENLVAYRQSRYIMDYAHFPLCHNTTSEYLPIGEVKFERMKEELQKAKHFIFLEYFIIERGIMWDGILDILKEKVKEGVEVRVIYDDIGCVNTLPYNYYKKLEEVGIQCVVFNPFRPRLNALLNNRDHRKICVIDGYVGFTGGINLADEYINAYEKHGHWKDTAILLRGEGVWNLTLMFLQSWNFFVEEKENYENYMPHRYHPEDFENDGYVQPFGDSPLDNETVSENVYLNLINKAEKYIYISSPYLIVDNELVTALCLASKSGVDVRITTPFIGDKWFVHPVTQAYYPQLVEAGVKIYEYTPGFVHAKTFVVDDILAVVGTINMDYRSLYLHFECGVWLYKTKTVMDIKKDYLATLEKCKNITIQDCKNVGVGKRMLRGLLRVFAPLM